MPCATIHLRLADKALCDWRGAPDRAPFPLSPATVSAFLHGNLAPDWGFVPGGDRFQSVLAHYVSPARLAQTLVETAGTAEETAFAWGWVAHVLSDVALHPQVGFATGERLRGSRDVRVNALDAIETHVGLEVGWDIITGHRHPEIPPPPSELLFDAHSIEYLVRAYRSTYGVALSSDAFLRSHIVGTRRTARWPSALRWLAHSEGLEAPRSGGHAMAVRIGRGVAPRASAFRGFLTPLRPPEWLLAEADRYHASFTDTLAEIQARGPAALEDRNLESGTPSDARDPHPEAVAARLMLSRMR